MFRGDALIKIAHMTGTKYKYTKYFKHNSIKLDNAAFVRLLYKKGLDVNAQDAHGNSTLTSAAFKCYIFD